MRIVGHAIRATHNTTIAGSDSEPPFMYIQAEVQSLDSWISLWMLPFMADGSIAVCDKNNMRIQVRLLSYSLCKVSRFLRSLFT